MLHLMSLGDNPKTPVSRVARGVMCLASGHAQSIVGNMPRPDPSANCTTTDSLGDSSIPLFPSAASHSYSTSSATQTQGCPIRNMTVGQPSHYSKHYKTQLCPFLFGENKHCAKGNKCGYAHSNEELRSRPDLRKTKLCSAYMKGQCTDRDCKYAHGRHELRWTHQYYKTSPCKYWACGTCYAGDNCRHAHGEGEIREKALPRMKFNG